MLPNVRHLLYWLLKTIRNTNTTELSSIKFCQKPNTTNPLNRNYTNEHHTIYFLVPVIPGTDECPDGSVLEKPRLQCPVFNHHLLCHRWSLYPAERTIPRRRAHHCIRPTHHGFVPLRDHYAEPQSGSRT